MNKSDVRRMVNYAYICITINNTIMRISIQSIAATFLTLSLKKLPMLFYFNYQRLNYFV